MDDEDKSYIRVCVAGRVVEWELPSINAVMMLQTLVASLGPGKDVVEEEVKEEKKEGVWDDIWAEHRPDPHLRGHRFYLQCSIDGQFYSRKYFVNEELLSEEPGRFGFAWADMIHHIEAEHLTRKRQMRTW